MLQEQSFLGVAVSLNVPNSNGWPDREVWGKFDVHLENFNNNDFKIYPSPWSPKWLITQGYDLLSDQYLEKNCRPDLSVNCDPCVTEVSGFSCYTSSGQRESVRAMAFAPKGSTLVVNLPTGSGKSLVGYLPSLLGKAEGALTLFVVPTVALALDQARQMRMVLGESTGGALVWYGGLSKEDKSLIKKNIRTGRQRILFTSPEAVCGSLRWSLYDSARKGYLKYVVIDEVHLVTQWGVNFRPDFQALSGVWKGLLNESGNTFKTLLMTATLTGETLETLRQLFASPGPGNFQVVSAVHLRAEPRYWHYKAENDLEKRDKVLEAVRSGLSPFILYVTEPEEARVWYRILKSSGFERIACFHGETDNKSRLEIIQEWSNDQLDGIVATSAFGVGMDKGDVRMVLHATVPENLDRYYQEVGRGGRDGRPMLSLLIYTDADLDRARRMAYPKLVSEELGLSRWGALIDSRRIHPDDTSLHILNLSTKPPHVKQDSDYNRAWNMRTILLMVRAGVVQLESQPPPTSNIEDEYDLTQDEVDEYLDQVVVRFSDETNHCDLEFWNTVVAQSRNQSVKASARNYDLLEKILEKNGEVGRALADLYTINQGEDFVYVSNYCGGCSFCREKGHVNKEFLPATVVPPRYVSVEQNVEWPQIMPFVSPNPIVVSFTQEEGQAIESLLPPLIEILVKSVGVREIVLSEDLQGDFKEKLVLLYKHTPEKFIIHRVLDEDRYGVYKPQLPRITVMSPWEMKPIPAELLCMEKSFHMIFAPLDTPDGNHPNRRYCDTEKNHLTLKELMMRLNL